MGKLFGAGSRRGLLLAIVVAGQAAADSAPVSELDTWVVTASRIAQPPGDVLAPMLVIRREEIERSTATDITQLLRFHAGLDIGRNGGPGQATSVFIRGAESNHTLVLVDGVRINPGTIGGAALQNISPEVVERIEVIKGPRSTLYGTEAIGGVVNVITRADSADGWFDSAVGGGRYDTRSASLNAGFGAGPLRLSTAVGHTDTAGFPSLAGNAHDRAHRNTTLNLGAAWDQGAVATSLRHWQADGETEYLGFAVDPAAAPPLGQAFTNSSTELAMAGSPTAGWSTRVALTRVEDDIRQLENTDSARTRRTALDWQNDFAIGRWQTLVAGVQAYREKTAAEVFGLAFDEDTTETSLYIQDTVSLDRHRLLAAARHTDHETFGSDITWNLEYGYDFAAASRVILSAGTGLRAPDSTDRFGFGGNPGLKPETSRNLELALVTTLGDGHRLRAGVFENDIDDLISFDFDPVTFGGINRNIDAARIRGAELGYQRATESWQLRANLIIQDPQDRATGQTLPRRARRSATATLVRLLGPHELGLDLLATDRRRDSAFSDTTNAGYLLANLSFRAALSEHLNLTGRLENLLDADYETAAGFSSAGRGLYLTLRYAR